MPPSPLSINTNSRRSRKALASCRLRLARVAGVAPSTATMRMRDATPLRSCSTKACCCGVGARGRNADISALNGVCATITIATSMVANHTAITTYPRVLTGQPE